MRWFLSRCHFWRQKLARMMKHQEQDEFVTVRVQDPRIQNEGSWSAYVDFKIFLHTNSKAFTAKTSCVRRRYSEFVVLKKRLQKNAGLVPVPQLPSKTFFFSFNEDFIERRRKGLQHFLDKLLLLTVCLSDSWLHLFLQTQLPMSHIQDCVHGHTPYTVTEAILTYASSNRGWAQEEETVQDHIVFPVSYESVDSPAPHLPSIQNGQSIDCKTTELGSHKDVSCGFESGDEEELLIVGSNESGAAATFTTCEVQVHKDEEMEDGDGIVFSVPEQDIQEENVPEVDVETQTLCDDVCCELPAQPLSD